MKHFPIFMICFTKTTPLISEGLLFMYSIIEQISNVSPETLETSDTFTAQGFQKTNKTFQIQ